MGFLSKLAMGVKAKNTEAWKEKLKWFLVDPKAVERAKNGARAWLKNLARHTPLNFEMFALQYTGNTHLSKLLLTNELKFLTVPLSMHHLLSHSIDQRKKSFTKAKKKSSYFLLNEKD